MRSDGKISEKSQQRKATQRKERQHEDTVHLQDIGKGQRESGFAKMTEEEREETKASKPHELLSKEDLFRILRLELSGAKTIDDITGIAARYQAAIESYPVTVRSNIENVTVDTDAASGLPDDAPPFLLVRIYGEKLFTQVRVSDGIWDAGPLRRNADTDCIGTRNSHGHVPGQ